MEVKIENQPILVEGYIQEKVFQNEIVSEETTDIATVSIIYNTEEIELDKFCYTNDDLLILAKVINTESGDECTDEHKMYVGQVVLNRVLDERFPNTLEEVVYQTKPTKQYACIDAENFNKYPSVRSIECATKLLNGEKVCDEDIVWQSEFVQGETVKVFKTNYSITYFGR